MKSIVTIALFVLTFSVAHSQSFNKEVNASGEKPTLLGKINKKALSEGSYGTWFNTNYEKYQPDETNIAAIKDKLEGYTIMAFMGTWCGDSKKEVPKFYKLLDAANFPLDRLTMVGVSRDRATYKQSPGGEEEGRHVARVPTFIFYKDGKEVNRFVERPIETLDKDILQLVEGNYESSYQIIANTGELLTEMGVENFQKKTKKIAKKLKPISNHHRELNTYSSVLFFAKRDKEAIAVARLNTMLYPEEADTFVSLGNKLLQTNKAKEALTQYEKAIALDPEHKQAKEAIAQLEGMTK